MLSQLLNKNKKEKKLMRDLLLLLLKRVKRGICDDRKANERCN